MQASFPFVNVYIYLKQYKYTLNSTSGKPRKSSLKLHFSFGYAKDVWQMLVDFHLPCFIGKTSDRQ